MKLATTLRARLALLVLTAIAPLFVLSLVGAELTSKDAVRKSTENLELSASLVAASQQRIADSVRQLLSAISFTPDLLEGKEPFCQRYFKTVTTELKMYTNVGIIGADGFIRCHSAPNNPKLFAGDRPYFQAAMASGDFGAGGYLLGRLSGKPVRTFALPVKASDGKIQAVAFAAILLTDVAKILTAISLPKGHQVVVMDLNGLVLAVNPSNPALIGQQLPDAQVKEAIKAGVATVFEGLDASGAGRIYAFRPSNTLPKPVFFVLVSADKREMLAPARLRLMRNLAALVLIALFGTGLAWLLARRSIMEPVNEILAAASRIQAGKLDTRISVNPGATKNELIQIFKSFNSMADSIQQREQDQARDYAELCTAKSRLVAAQKLGRIGYWELDIPTGRLTWSDELPALFGLKPDEFDGQHVTFLNMIHPDDRARYETQRAAAFLNGTALEITYRITTPAGDVRWMHQRGQTAPLNEAGPPLSRSGVVQDVTAEHESREHLQLLETAIARLNDVILITEAEPSDKPGPRIVFVNDAFEKQTGYSREEALGSTPRMLQGPNTQKSELYRITQAIKAWQPVRVELINYTKGGTEYWVEFEIVPIANDKGWFTHWVSVQRDITQRKQAEKALLDSERRYAALFENAPVPMWVFDALDHRFLTVNSAAVESYGYSVAEFLSMTIFDIREELDQTALREYLLGPPDPRLHWRHRRKDGSFLMVNGVAKSIQYAGKDACFVVAIDVTAQINAERGV